LRPQPSSMSSRREYQQRITDHTSRGASAFAKLHLDQRVIAIDTCEWLRRPVYGRDTSRVTVKVFFATAVLAGREFDLSQQHKVIATSEKCARECLSPQVALTMHFAGPGFL
jgi:hypothetical protein